MCTIIKSYPNPMTLRGQIRKYWGSVEATNHINDVTSMKDRLDVTFDLFAILSLLFSKGSDRIYVLGGIFVRGGPKFSVPPPGGGAKFSEAPPFANVQLEK